MTRPGLDHLPSILSSYVTCSTMLYLFSHRTYRIFVFYFSTDPFAHISISCRPSSDAESYKTHRPDLDLTIVEGNDHPFTIPTTIPNHPLRQITHYPNQTTTLPTASFIALLILLLLLFQYYHPLPFVSMCP